MRKIILLLCVIPSFAFADFNTECEIWENDFEIKAEYCVTTPPQTVEAKTSPIIYFLHGAGMSHHSWATSNVGRRARAYALEKGYEHPIVVTFSMGANWLLTEPKVLNAFVNSFMPYIEGRLPHNGMRGVWGLSMGGYNGFQLYLKKYEFFDVFTLGCPAVSTISPFSSDEEVLAYIRRTGASSQLVFNMKRAFKKFFSTTESWDQHDVLKLAKDLDQKRLLPPLSFSCGDKDEFGFQEGNGLLAEILTSKQLAVSYTELDGTHCEMDIPAFVDFQQKVLY